MAYTIRFKASAVKSLASLPRTIQLRVRAKTLELTDAPRPSGSVKLAGHEGLYRIRVGDYRIVYQIDDAATAIEITIIAHRREVYRGL